MKILAGVVISWLAVGCARAPASNPIDPEEPVVETREAATVDIPRWRLFLGGPDLHLVDGGMVYYEQPRASDWNGGVIAVRAGDEGKPRKWVHLYLEMQRKHGDGYFLSLIANDKVTALDLVLIDALLMDAKTSGVEPPLISTLGEPVGHGMQRLDFEQPSQPPDLLDWGAAGSGSRGPRRPAGPHPYPNGNIPGQGGSPGPTNGVTPSGPGPTRTDFCDGIPCAWGDTSGIEWKPVPVTEKWTVKLGRFFDTYREELSATLRRDLFHDGKNPGCSDMCSYLSVAATGSLWTGLMLLCVAATDGVATGACMSGATGVIAGGASTVSGGAYGQWVLNYCNRNVCDQR